MYVILYVQTLKTVPKTKFSLCITLGMATFFKDIQCWQFGEIWRKLSPVYN